MLAFKDSLKNITRTIGEYRLNKAEILWQMIDNGITKWKIGVLYMPQESKTKLDKLKEIYNFYEIY